MIGIGFAERLAGGHHRPGELAPDRPFALDIVARPARDSWRVSGTVRAESITEAAPVDGRITRDGDLLRYELSVAGSPRLAIVGQKLLRLRDLYASLSMFRGSFRDDGREVATIAARVDLRNEWRYCLRNLRLSMRAP
jgi:hypothetical protein